MIFFSIASHVENSNFMWKFYLCSSELSQNIICKKHQAPKIDHLKACGGDTVCLIGSLVVCSSESVTSVLTH